MFLLCLAGANAQTIDGVSGTVTHGSSITISGLSFGSKSTAAQLFWDTVDNQSAYSGLSDGDTIPTGPAYPWTSADYGNSSGEDHVKFETTDAQRGVSTEMYKAVNQKWAYLDGNTWDGTDYFYVSWWFKVDQSIYNDGSTASPKLLRLSNSSDETGKTTTFSSFISFVYNNPNSGGIHYHDFTGNPTDWVFYEVWVNSSNRTYTTRINGVAEDNNISWADVGTFQINELWKIGFDNGGVSPFAITWWMDDIYYDSSFARVMIGNASTYSASTHFEMQPITAWSTSSISVTINRGSFGATDTAYLYVIDSSGTVSTGYEITFGNTESGGTTQTISGGIDIKGGQLK